MQLEQQERKEQRLAAVMRWASRNRTPPKPLAPVEQVDEKVDGARVWRWVGETIASKGIAQGENYHGEWIRKMGYKLPVLVKPVKTKAQRKPKAEGIDGK